eukprot:TRINITY_DN11509_c0_g1_i2.p1 TRINITY_DN11509_c0_g1~~TRINITY_DN11509_c0_g1_i2.p1  ORF type:complete len:148 (-),score=5.15 TRINITY_DN11509_c0_g1_i2:169-612(-)
MNIRKKAPVGPPGMTMYPRPTNTDPVAYLVPTFVACLPRTLCSPATQRDATEQQWGSHPHLNLVPRGWVAVSYVTHPKQLLLVHSFPVYHCATYCTAMSSAGRHSYVTCFDRTFSLLLGICPCLPTDFGVSAMMKISPCRPHTMSPL